MKQNLVNLKNSVKSVLRCNVLLWAILITCMISRSAMAQEKPAVDGKVLFHQDFETSTGTFTWPAVPVVLDTKIFKSGKSSIQFTPDNNYAAYWYLKVISGHRYTVSLAYRADKKMLARNGISIAFNLPGQGNASGGRTSLSFGDNQADSEWHQFEGTFDVPTGVNNAQFLLDFFRSISIVNIDDLTVIDMGPSPEPVAAAPIATQQPAPPVKQNEAPKASSTTHPVGTMSPLTTKKTILPPDQSGYAFTGNIEQVGYVSAESPSMIYFRPINPSHRPDLFIALPEGIDLLGGFRGFQLIPQGQSEMKGEKFNIIRIATQPSSSKYTFIWRADPAKKWPDGFKLHGYYWGEWAQGKQSPIELPIEVVKIPQVQPFTKIPVWMSIPSDLAAIWPDMNALRQSGFNYMDIWAYARKDSEYDWGMKVLREAHSKMQQSGIKPIAWIREWWWEDARKDLDGQAMTIDGKRINALRLSYRGKYFQELIDQGKRLIDEGFYFHCTDPEIYGNGESIDFSPQTIELFKKYFSEHSPNLPYISPQEFEREPVKYAESHRLWNEFKAQQYTAFFADYRKAMEAYMKEKGIKEPFRMMIYSSYHRSYDGFYGYQDYRLSPIYIHTLEDPTSLAKVFDYISPMIYTDVFANYNDYDMTLPWKDTSVLRTLGGSSATVAPLLSTGYPFIDAYDSDISSTMLRYNILETFAGGGKGFGYWGVCPIDAMDLKVTAEIVRMLQPYEELILQGQISSQIKPEKGTVFTHRIENKSQSLVFVSEYSDTKLTDTIECPVKTPSKVIDLQTNQVIAKISPQNSSFPVTLDKNRALVFFVGPEN